MRIKITHDFAKLVRAFEAAPEETERLVRLQVEMAVRDIREYAADNHRFVTRSGATEKSIVSKSEGSAGEVWLASPVAVYQHEGTHKHEIVPRNKRALRWAVPGGFAFAKRVNVSGIKPDPYLYKAAEYQEPRIMARCEQALGKLLGGI